LMRNPVLLDSANPEPSGRQCFGLCGRARLDEANG
jgi:hypothetical protein